MKKFMTPLFMLCLLICSNQQVQANDRYLESMKKNIETVYSANTIEEIQTAVNSLERIGNAEKDKWEPYYYSAFGYIMMAVREQDNIKKDSDLDMALKSIEKAKTLIENESEIIALEGFVHMIRVSVDPAARGQQYSGMAMQSFSKALSINAENPRALYLLSQMQFGMAKFFGSPTTEACNTLAKSLEKFDSYKPENPLAPQWGKSSAEKLKGQCQ